MSFFAAIVPLKTLWEFLYVLVVSEVYLCSNRCGIVRGYESSVSIVVIVLARIMDGVEKTMIITKTSQIRPMTLEYSSKNLFIPPSP